MWNEILKSDTVGLLKFLNIQRDVRQYYKDNVTLEEVQGMYDRHYGLRSFVYDDGANTFTLQTAYKGKLTDTMRVMTAGMTKSSNPDTCFPLLVKKIKVLMGEYGVKKFWVKVPPDAFSENAIFFTKILSALQSSGALTYTSKPYFKGWTEIDMTIA